MTTTASSGNALKTATRVQPVLTGHLDWRCPELMLGGVHGMDEVAVYQELCEVVEEWLTITGAAKTVE